LKGRIKGFVPDVNTVAFSTLTPSNFTFKFADIGTPSPLFRYLRSEREPSDINFFSKVT
jgi:hypothetical protein